MKTIVAHISPDLDAAASSWLLLRFRPGWKNADIAFVPAGTTLDNMVVDSNPDIAHVDTGLGIFDHHQFNDKTLSATKRVFQYLTKNGHIKDKDFEALNRLVEFVTSIDNFGEVYFHDPTADRYDFMLHQIVEGFKTLNKSGQEICEFTFEALDSILQLIRQKIAAEDDIKNGYIFQSKWGKALAMETKNEEALKYALKLGYRVVIRRNPQKGFTRIKSRPEKEIDLTPVHDEIKKLDKKGTWFLHVSKHMLLNGSSKNPTAVPSSLPLKKVIEIIQKID